jgi:hypothetical protein
MIGAPVAFLAGTLVHPGLDNGASAQLELIATHPDRWYLTHVLGAVAVVLFVPAVLGAVQLVRERAPLLGPMGGGLALLGLLGWTGIVTVYGLVAWQMPGGDPGEMAALFHRINHSAGVVVPLRLGSMCMVAGMVMLAIGAARARVAGPWSALFWAAGFPLFAAGGLTAQVWLLTAGTASMAIGLGSVGLSLLRAG